MIEEKLTLKNVTDGKIIDQRWFVISIVMIKTTKFAPVDNVPVLYALCNNFTTCQYNEIFNFAKKEIF